MNSRIALILAVMMLLTAGAGMAEETGAVIPEIETKDMLIPDNEAMRLIRDMKAGWNLGNTFDAIDCHWLKNPLEYERGWCGVITSEKLMDALQQAGFRTIRIPVSWHNHLDKEWTIDPAWLARVQEVAGWAYDRGMYVIVNIHHDCDPAYYYPDTAHSENSEKYMRTIWHQLAEAFRDWGNRLILESINEPRLKDTDHEWWWDASHPECQDAMAQIVKLNQVFVDTVRATGGNNADRYLMVPAYDASPDYACESAFTLPEDSADNRIIVSAHAYSPYNFALEQPGIDSFSLNNASQKSGITGFLDKLYHAYVARGIPVLMGEFGAMEKNGNLQDRVNWIAYYVSQARARGITCCWWDNHVFQGNGERFGLFDREKAACVNPVLLEAFMRYAE